MTGITVRVLTEDQWSAYRTIRLAASQESPEAFASTGSGERQDTESHWRAELVHARRLLAARDGVHVGVVSVGPSRDHPRSADVFGLWVAPEVRNTGIAWRLVEAAAEQAVADGHEQLCYWVGTQNGRAVGFAINFGFRTTSHRRLSRFPGAEPDAQEIALVLPLVHDPADVPNPAGPRLLSRPGPAGDEADETDDQTDDETGARSERPT